MSDAPRPSQPTDKEPVLSMSVQQAGRNLLWLLYTNNPFYLLSACAVFHGVALWYQADAGPHRPWSLTALVAGYIIMMAAAGFGIVRFGRVWDDARSILLVIVLLFPVLALTLDDTMLNNLSEARLLAGGGFLFVVLISEGLLHGLRIRLPLVFRIPYYGMLALLFVYPLVLLPGATDDNPSTIAWRIFLFSPLSAAVFLSLVPAIRGGANVVRDNGTPWNWPRYPWAIFVVLGVCVCFRAYSLSLSFDPVLSLGRAAAMQMQSAFGIYFFVPIVLSVAVLLLEFGLVGGKKELQRVAILLPVFCLTMSIPQPGANAAYSHFLTMFTERLGSPVYLTLWASSLFFLYACLRKVCYAELGVVAALLLLSVVAPGTIGIATLVAPRPVPLVLLGLFELALAIRTIDSRRFTIAALSCAAVLQLTGATVWLTTAHLAGGALLLIGVLCRDEFARQLRQLAAIGLAAGCVTAMFFPPDAASTMPGWTVPLYVATLISIAIGLAISLRSPAFLVSAAVGTGAVGLEVSWRATLYLRDWPGIESFLLATLLFVVAVAISILKTGWGRRLLLRVGAMRVSTNGGG